MRNSGLMKLPFAHLAPGSVTVREFLQLAPPTVLINAEVQCGCGQITLWKSEYELQEFLPFTA